ncbi:hypothetical protein [Candidatus Methylomirabilis sp.]|uniref:hypothetical protein n=1 Tax=Candidatus Methylomirabilis sp. TaxID=2032687 RepID=UPI0030763CF4
MSNSGNNRSFRIPERRPRRSQLHRLLDPTTYSVTLDTLTRAAHAVGRQVTLELV